MDAEITFDQVDITTVKKRSITGIITLISRSFVQRIVSSVGFFFISIFLSRPDIGIFIAINDLVSILGYFSDIGLAASLIQKKSAVTTEDLRTTFTLQQIIVCTILLLTLIISPVIIRYYDISSSGIVLFFSLLAAFFLASLKTIPSVMLERSLRFEKLAIVEMTETIIFYVVVVFVAWRGGGVASYAIAVLLRGIVGTALLYKLAPWPIGLGISRNSVKSLLSFGVPYQINSLMAVVKDRFVNIALWRIIGADGVGILGWAQNWAQLPLRFVMDNVTKVTFPAYARMHDHPQELKAAIEKTLFFITFLTFPLVGGLAIVAPMLIKIIPKYGKWEVALMALSFYCFNSAWACVSTPLTNVLNALGKVRINTYLMIMWTTLTWGLTPYLAIKYGYNGVAIATGIIALSSIVPIVIVKKLVDFRFSRSIVPPLAGVLVMLCLAFYLVRVLPASLPSMLVVIVSSAIVYLVVNLAFLGQTLIADMKKLSYAFFRRKK